jgi:hypothetical protein
MAALALFVVGGLLVVAGILAGGSIPFVGLGVLALVTGAIVQVAVRRRR